ncbi:MAG: adenine-specific methyltransferase EcoRI family protein [Bacteroidales bacterium]|nr:adenine-specific methyltransferase EcoRI family protein [Bacteroidales bacterium]
MAKNDNLHKAKRAKADEFYTQLSDIENECKHYWEHFKGKTILCNCDDPRVSNFFRYFSLNFEHLGLKKLIATCYKNQDIDLFSQESSEKAVYIIYEGDKNGNRQVDDKELEVKELQGDGDFRSKECIELLKEADIVVTNPPFSLFREYVAQLIEYEKKFLIIGTQNAITYKEIFPLLKENKMWLGYGFKGSAGHFISKYEDVATAGDHREGMIRVSGVTWFTNLEHNKRHEELILYKEYNPEKVPNEYPKYENYNAIEVSKTAEIPMNYNGVMGVPVTFMYKYNPEQFEIIGMAEDNGKGLSGEAAEWDGKNPHCIINGKAMYKRIFIRKK